MRGRSVFSPNDARQIRDLLRQKVTADRAGQKVIRGSLRQLGFYITDWDGSNAGFTADHFDALVRSGRITITETAIAKPTNRTVAPPVSTPAVRQRDEAYVIDLCDAVLGRHARRQHRFSFLLGDAGTSLPVDAFYPDLNLVVEYHERQHTEAVPLFDRRMTVSGVDRGTQRARYAALRRQVLPQHGITLVVIAYTDLAHDNARRLRRDAVYDGQVIARLLLPWRPTPASG